MPELSRALLMALVIGPLSCQAADWPQWRGPTRDGISADTGLLKRWPVAGPQLVRTVTGLGQGYASQVVAGGRVVTIGKDAAVVFARCFSEKTGQLQWSTRIGETGRKALSTPTIDGERIYALEPDGTLHCLRASDGQVIWKRSFASEFGGKLQNGRGFAESPLVDGDYVVGTPGAGEHTMVLLDKMTGKTQWSCAVGKLGPRGRIGAGFSSPVATTIDGVRIYIQFIGYGVIGVRARDGKLMWGYNRIAIPQANIPTPVVVGKQVFASNGYNCGSALLSLFGDGKGGVRFKEEYHLRGREFQNHHGGFVHVDGHIYGGHGSNNGLPTCIELETGDVLWKRRGPGSGSASVIFADGSLYMRYSNGVVALVDASPEGFRLKGTMRLPAAGNDSWSHPALAGGHLYLRENDSLHIYDVRAEE
jgi:outer membrane protein assembly factor BamB